MFLIHYKWGSAHWLKFFLHNHCSKKASARSIQYFSVNWHLKISRFYLQSKNTSIIYYWLLITSSYLLYYGVYVYTLMFLYKKYFDLVLVNSLIKKIFFLDLFNYSILEKIIQMWMSHSTGLRIKVAILSICTC